MTNSLNNKMAGKNSAPGRPRSTTKLRPYITSIATPPRNKTISNNISCGVEHDVKLRLNLSPFNIRTSPSYFAGCKWSDPPSPDSLPKPPHHWTQVLGSASKCSAFNGTQTDIASQLKVLLNVQA